MSELVKLYNEIECELKEHILPFFGLKDRILYMADSMDLQTMTWK